MSLDLSNYVLVGRYDLPEPTRTSAPSGNLLAQEASGVTYNWDTNTLFVVGDGGTSVTQVSLTGQLIDTMTLAQGSSPQGTAFYDTEGITYVGNGQFVFTEERWRQVDEFTYAAGTTLTRGDAHTVDLGSDVGNVGLEGLTYDPFSGGFIVVKEKDPESIFQTSIDFANGTATNGSSSTVAAVDLFNPALVGTTDLSDVYALSSNASYVGASDESHLLIISQESGKVVEIGRDGTVYGTLTLTAPPTSSGIDLAAMTVEGITMGPDGKIYLVSEEGGGDFDHPQLWVFAAPETGPNAAPTGITLASAVSSILENSSTATHIKVADIAIADDGQGTNVLSLSGADAAKFEVDSSGLYLKAGTALDYETKTSYSVTVNVDDTSVGGTPDASTDYTLKVGNVVNEGPAGSVAITEVAPWSSSSPVGADWFEITNTGSTALDLTGWKMDDNSYAFGSAVAMSGVSSLAPGESAIFLEGGATQVTAFINTWFGGNAPAGFKIGTYSGSGVGLSTSGDAVAVFDGAGNLKASVTFGASPSALQTFDNSAQINSTSLVNHATISTLSTAGTNGAGAAAGDASETGSPGSAGGVPAPVNHAPTALGLTGEITSLTDDTSTSSHVKVASIIVTDDGLGTNALSLSGADAALFEVDSTGLYIKAGATLDATVKSHYDVTVNVDDPTVGGTPDASASYALDLTHVVANPLKITEVAAWSSGNSPVGADWFEVTNTGNAAANIGGWKMDDSSNSFSDAVALNGISSIAAGESVIFIETSSAATVQAFVNTWFGGNLPAGLQIGTYSGGGVGLSTGGDGVNLFNASGVHQAGISFGSSPNGPFPSFDNGAGADGVTVSTLSSVGSNGAFTAAGDAAEIGSPGRIATPTSPSNEAPTAVSLTNVTGTLQENTSTAAHIKVADIAITDDGAGTNTLSLSGADASFFEISGTGLYIKAGTVLDYETKAAYAVTVNVDDPTVGSTPDASTNYALNLTDVANEGGAPVVRITEVAPWSSGDSPVGADWFEVTNTGTAAVSLAGWKMDDNSFSFGNSVALNGISSIGAGESVIFIEGTAATAQTFIDTWFGGTAPAGFKIGYYSGGGVGLSTSGDGVALYDGSGALQAKVSFGSSPSSSPFGTFENTAGLDNVTLTTLSTAGANGAFHAPGDSSEIGSPGAIVNPPNQAPTAVALANATASIDENTATPVHIKVADVVVTDDGHGTNTLFLSGADASFFELDGSALYLKAGTLLDYETKASYDVAVNVDDLSVGGTPDASIGYTLHVGDLYEGPPIFSGTSAKDILNGTDGDEVLKGLNGDDKLFANGGNDILIGGEGRDTLNGGEGIDTASYAEATTGVAADLGAGKGTYGEAIGDKLVDIENLTGSSHDDALYGDRFDNVLSGGDGNDDLEGIGGDDTLIGGKGNDILIGGKGSDTMSGGEGADLFIFAKGESGKTIDKADTITDFVSGLDKIDFTSIDAITKTKDVFDEFNFIGDSVFHKVAGELRYEVSGSDLYLIGDMSGDGKGDFMVHFTGITSLAATDFLHLS